MNRRHAVHLHHRAKPEKGTERERNRWWTFFEEHTNEQNMNEFKERNCREKKCLMRELISRFQEQRKRTDDRTMNNQDW